MLAYIGRQAIYNQDMVIAGYELLYRSGAGRKNAMISDEDAATRGVLSDAVTVFGIQQLTNNLPAYVNFTRNLLMNDFALLVDPYMIVIEIPSNINMDNALELKLTELRRAGYRLALDGYSEVNGMLRFDRIIDMFDVIRINVSGWNRLQLANLLRRLKRSRAKLLAERIETEEDFDNALKLNFSLFQGYYFEKPTCLSKEIPSLGESSYGRLLNELLSPSVNFDRCAKIIQDDVVLTYLFLRQIQITVFDRSSELSEIRRGLLIMGTEEVRRWTCLVLLKQSNAARSDELSRKAFLRGLFMERLMENSDTDLDPRQGFLMGILSLLDKVMGVRLESLLADLRLEKAMKDALLGKAENDYTMFLQYVVIYEMANPRLILPDIGLKLSERQVSSLYMECMSNTDSSFEYSYITAPVYRGNLLR